MGYKFIGQTLTNTQLGNYYHNMISRCYNANVQTIKPCYIGCSVCSLWYDPDGEKYQRQADNPCRHAFYDWIREHYYRIDGEPQNVQLDKDIKVKGNKVYSPDTCLLVPKAVNSFFGGIHGQKNIREDPDGSGYIVTLYTTKRHASTYEDAENIYKGFIEGRRNQLLEQYYGKVPQDVYNAIQAYEF